MDRFEFYRLIDIDTPEDFEYYENLESILEGDDYIEPELLEQLFVEVKWDSLGEIFENYFKELFRILPDKEDELQITLDGISRKITGILDELQSKENARSLAEEVVKFKKWFVSDELVGSRDNNATLSIRDAVYNIHAMKFGGAFCDYDFSNACDYKVDGYDINLSSLIEKF